MLFSQSKLHFLDFFSILQRLHVSIFLLGDSTLSVVCKILESIVRDHISKYLKINEIITPSQHGFVPNRACMTNLLETLYVITNVVNKGKSVDLVLLDLNQSF